MDARTRRWWRDPAAAAVAGALSLAAPTLLEATQDTSEVTVVHGIPDQPVDVYLDGELAFEDLQPGEFTDPEELPADTYTVALTPPGEPVDGAIVSGETEIPGGENLSLVAHLSEDGEPTLGSFTNDVGSVPAGEARLSIAHTAAAPAVDVQVDGSEFTTDLTNGIGTTEETPAETAAIEVTVASTGDAVIGQDVTVAENSLTNVYIIGSADDDTLELVQEVIPL